jgi:RimJ/RimL family protein N-acetyltransferase
MNIRSASAQDLPAYFQHCLRHMRESGNGPDVIFHPVDDFESWNLEEKVQKTAEELAAPVGKPGWSRIWICELGGQIVADASVSSVHLPTAGHRCQFAIGCERLARGQGLGRRLSLRAIEWARAEPGLEWMDLWVMGHNAAAIALYESLGFAHLGRIQDQFRLQGKSVDDVRMAIRLK